MINKKNLFSYNKLLLYIGISLLAILVACDSSSPFSSPPTINPSIISNVDCGSTIPIQANAYYQWGSQYNIEMLCWALTNSDSTKTKITPQCIKQSGPINSVFQLKIRNDKISPYQETIFAECHFFSKGKCVDNYDFSVPGNYEKVSQTIPITVSCNYCGDGKITIGEDCDGLNLLGKNCFSQGFGSGTLKCGSNCKFDTSQCSTCGNSKIDNGETCASCPIDVKCGYNQACSNSGQCIQLGSDENCAFISNKCNTQLSNFIFNGKIYCSSSSNNILIKEGYKTKERCLNNLCVKETVPSTEKDDCGSEYCQDGKCGCSYGFEKCIVSNKCEKKNSLVINDHCGCDFQCKEGFCDEKSGKCIEGLSFKIKTDKEVINLNDETEITFGVSNSLNQDIEADILINIGNGLSLTEVKSGDQCGGSQCKLDRKKIPAGAKNDIILKIKAINDIDTNIEGKITYSINNIQNKQIRTLERLEVIKCGNGKAEKGETRDNCCIDIGCPTNNQFTTYSCNKNTFSCEKNWSEPVKLWTGGIILGIGSLVLVIYFLLHKPRLNKNQSKNKKKLGIICNKCEAMNKEHCKFCKECGGELKNEMPEM